MGAGGVTRQTGRNNTVMPYNVGFLNEATDTDKYNVAVYDELHKVSAASTHMFQALDDIHKEIDVRIAALDAMNLKYDALNNRITTQIATAIAQIQQQIGNLSLDDINDLTDPNNPIKLSGTISNINTTISGVKTTVSGVDAKVTTVEGIANNNGSEIAVIQNNMKNKTGDMAQYMQLSEFDAVWGVNSHVNGRTAGVALVNNGTFSYFRVAADKFQVVDPSGATGSMPFTVENGKAKMDWADIKNANITTAQIANARINFANIDNVSISSGQIQNLTTDKLVVTGTLSKSGPQGTWAFNDQGGFAVTGADDGRRVELDANGLRVYQGNALRIVVGKW